MALHQKIAYFRERAGLSQRQLAEKAGVSPGAIGQYETKKSKPSIDTLFRLATALNVTVSELFDP